MTTRSNRAHRLKEFSAAVLGFLVNKSLSRKSGGIIDIAKSLVVKRVGKIVPDRELDHPEEWDRPID